MTMRAIKFSTAVVGLFAYACCAFAQQSVGRFDGEVVAKFMRDGRNMQVELRRDNQDETGATIRMRLAPGVG